MISTSSVCLAYGDGAAMVHAVDNVSVVLPQTGFVGFMGPSGSGKSSLLYLMAGLKSPTAGSVQYENNEIGQMTERERVDLRRSQFGMVFQQPFLIHYLTAIENVMTASVRQDKPSKERAQSLFLDLEIASLSDKLPHQLSGGERQRVCVARAMISKPKVIFADEPTASLDQTNGHNVIRLLASYKQSGLVVVVTHDPEMVREADVVYCMRDGRIEGQL